MSRTSDGKPNNRGREKEGNTVLLLSRRGRFSVSQLAFALIGLFLLISVVRYLFRDRYETFTVEQPCSMSSSRTVDALVLREETVYTAPVSGTVDRYVQAGGRAKNGAVVASIDETGTYSRQLRELRESETPSEETLLRLKSGLREIASGYDSRSFSAVTAALSRMDASYLGSSYSSVPTQLDLQGGADFFHCMNAASAGTVLYYTDGLESLRPSEVTAELFKDKEVQRTLASDQVTAGDLVYKQVSSEEWSLIVPVTDAEAALYTEKDTLEIEFPGRSLSATAKVHSFTGADAELYLELELDRYVMHFLEDRYVRIRLITSEQQGYKLPTSALVNERFYLIPKAFWNAESSSVLVKDETGSGRSEGDIGALGGTVTELRLTKYAEDENYVYIGSWDLKSGMLLAAEQSTEVYTVRLTGTLTGVYEVGGGIVRFRKAAVLAEQGAYSLVSAGSDSTVSAYDVILLEPAEHEVGEILYTK